MPLKNRFAFHPNLIFAYITLFYLGLSDNLRGPFFPALLERFQLSSQEGAWYFAVSSVMNFVGAALVPALARKAGYKWALWLSVGLMFLSQALAWLAPTYGVFLLSSAVLGLSVGFLGVLQNVMVLVAAPAHVRARVSGGLHTVYALASFFAPLVISFLAARQLSLQLAFAMTSVMGVTILLLIARVSEFLEPSDRHAPPAGSTSLNFPILYFALMFAGYVAGEIAAGSRLAQFAHKSLGWSISEASTLSFQFFMGLFVGRLALALLPMRVPVMLCLRVALSLAVTFALLGLYHHPLWFLMFGVVMGPIYPLTMTALSETFPGQIQSAATAAVTVSGVAVLLMHLGVGALSDAYGVGVGLLVSPGLCFFVLILNFLYPVVFRSQNERHGRSL